MTSDASKLCRSITTSGWTTRDYMDSNKEFCAHVWDIDGKQYIDFLSAFSVVNRGHYHPKIVETMMDQCPKQSVCTNATQNKYYPLLCKKICELLGYEMAASMSSSSEATGLAFKIAWKWGYRVKGIKRDQVKILTVIGNYHGKTLGPLSSSSNEMIRNEFGSFVPNVGPDVAGTPVRFNHIEDLDAAFKAESKNIAAVMMEPVQGYTWCLPAEPGYLKAVQDLCRKHDVLLILDEIQTGFGRTGTFMAYQHDDVKPDMVVLGKALTGGLYPMSLVLGSKAIMTQVRPGEYNSSFAASPLASAIAISAINVTLSEKLSERAQQLGQQLVERLNSIKSPHITMHITGRGLLCALHMDESHPSGKVTADRLTKLARSRGLMVFSAANRVRIAPPLAISETDLSKGLGILEQSLHDLLDWEDNVEAP